MIIFNRHISCQAEEIAENKVQITVNLCDSHHEITVMITVHLPETLIIDARAEFLRSPDKICSQTAGRMAALIGQTLGSGVSKMASSCVGGSTGCVHLKELVIEAAKALVQGQYFLRFGHYPDYREINEVLAQEQAGTCHLYSQPTNMA